VLEHSLATLVSSGRAAWPALALPPTQFLAYLAERLPKDQPLLRALALAPGDDLYLACACTLEWPGALDLFCRRYCGEITRTLARIGVPAQLAEELRQRVLERLFVPPRGRSPKIANYAGRGPLIGWLRQIVTRMARKLRAREGRHQRAALAELLPRPEGTSDPELAYILAQDQTELRQAFAHAVGSLGGRDRQVLRLALLEERSIDEVAALYRVHRATAARWIASARTRLFVRTRAQLTRKLRISCAEVDSMVAALRGEPDLQLSRELGRP
jgi:RNA polymerase sigma-70 factor (ECF subfamily)